MSTISQIFNSYRVALDQSRGHYESLYTERVKNAQEFYKSFFHRLIRQYEPIFTNPASIQQIRRQILRFFETDHIDFVAIDGTCSKDAFKDFITFFGGAYGAKGRISLEGDPPKVKYSKWAMNKDVSMVAYVPVPFAQISDVADVSLEETFVVSDAERINLSNIQTLIMQLAEIYLAYNVVTGSSIDSVKLLMMDLSPSSLMAGVAGEAREVHLAGYYPYDRRIIDLADIAIAYAHPFNSALGIPSTKKFKRYSLLVSEFHASRRQVIPISELQQRYNLTDHDLASAVNYLKIHRIAELDKANNQLKALVDVCSSWGYVVSFFQNLCKRLFVDKDQSALIYESTDENGVVRRRWLSPNDIKFLISVGIRALVEKCWERKIMLTGVVKDSDSRYLSRNYLGVMKHLNLYSELNSLVIHQLPWTDRIFLETLPLCDDNLDAPWSSVEFDSAFMTLFLYQIDPSQKPFISGVRGDIVSNERLFARSLAQFFLKREKATPLMGHVVFLDRLVFPEWDIQSFGHVNIETNTLGEVRPLAYLDNVATNNGQTIMMYLLSILTKNHFPEVIGYPDPLHKADWGAKSIGIKVRGVISSSEVSFRANPLSRTFRAIRDSIRRT